MDRCTRALFVAAGALLIVLMAAPSARAESRGELLYRTHCIACHTTQVHWRDRKLATDWASLRGEVRRWQADAQLGWSEADVLDVTRYLNDTIYRFPPPAGHARSVRGRAAQAPGGAVHTAPPAPLSEGAGGAVRWGRLGSVRGRAAHAP